MISKPYLYKVQDPKANNKKDSVRGRVDLGVGLTAFSFLILFLLGWYGFSKFGHEDILKGGISSPFRKIIVVSFSCFAGVIFTFLWKHTVDEVRKLDKEQLGHLKHTDKDEYERGMWILALAMMVWAFGGVLDLWVESPSRLLQYIQSFMSPINSGLFLVAVSSFKFKNPPSWYNRSLFVLFRNLKVVIGTVIGVCLLTAIAPFVGEHVGWDTNNALKIPDLILSFLTIYVLGHYLIYLFRDRKIKFLPEVTLAVLILTLFVQFFNFKIEGFDDWVSPSVQLVLSTIYVIFLAIIFFSLAYSYVYYWKDQLLDIKEEMNQKLILQTEQLSFQKEQIDGSVKELQQERDYKEDLRRKMSHAIRNSFNSVFDFMNQIEREKDIDGEELMKMMRTRILAIRNVHDMIHKKGIVLGGHVLLNLNNAIEALLLGLKSGFGYQYVKDGTEAPQTGNVLVFESMLSDEIPISPDYLVDISNMLWELIINADKIQSGKNKWIKIKLEILGEDLVISCLDKGPGPGAIPVNPDERGFGLNYLSQIVESYQGNGPEWFSGKETGTVVRLSIPLLNISEQV